MATTEGQRRHRVDELTIVDTDSHVNESLEDLVPYIDDRHRGITRMIRDSANPSYEIFSSHRPSPVFRQTTADHSPEWKKREEGLSLIHQDTPDPEVKLELMDEFGIDHSILTPGRAITISGVNHDPTAVALARAYNEYVTDNFAGRDGLSMTLVVPPQKPDVGAEEIDRWGDHDDIVGVQLPVDGLVPPPGYSKYDPIYEAAQDHGLPIAMHSGDSQAYSAFPVQRTWAETFLEAHAFTFPVQAIWHMVSMICQGVPERFPDLEFVLQEPGCEWLPWLMWRLDDHYLQTSEDVPILTKRPSEYIKDQYYFATQPLGHTENKAHLASILEIAGGKETILFSTDHPHADFDPPSELLASIQSSLDEEDVRGMMGETAVDVFDLDV